MKVSAKTECTMDALWLGVVKVQWLDIVCSKHSDEPRDWGSHAKVTHRNMYLQCPSDISAYTVAA